MNDRNKTKAQLIDELRALRRRVTKLEKQLRTEFGQDAEQQRIQHALGERVKELNCLYGITRVVDRCGDSVDELLQETVAILPGSWQYPEITCARIVFAQKEYTTESFQQSRWRQAADLAVLGQKAGVVEVYYLAEMPTLDEGPFLKEERLLIDAVAERTGRIIERIHARQQLQVERASLEQSNIAMRRLMDRINEEKAEIGQALQSNVDKIILPILHALESSASPQQGGYLSLLRRNLEEITSPFADGLAKAFMGLTPAEIRICDMVRRGMTTKEIARLQVISPSTVSRHREHIRHKLQLTNREVNLTTYLNTFMSDHAPEQDPARA